MHFSQKGSSLKVLLRHDCLRLSSKKFSTAPRLSQDQRLFNSIPKTIGDAAILLEAARRSNQQIKPLSSIAEYQNLTQPEAYKIAAAAASLRIAIGDKPVGRKIGFTNRNIWPEYNVDSPNWGYIYDSTVMMDADRIDIGFARGLEPKIEPEIVLGLSKTPVSTMNDVQMLGCVEWIAHGFEIVVSVFPGWKFTAADTTATGALHGCLTIGPKHRVQEQDASRLVQQLRDFKITLYKDSTLVDSGVGSNVLGSPVEALRFLTKTLEMQELHPQLVPGEIVTTGTLTSALAVVPGERWRTAIDGIDLTGLDITFDH